ncbi:esterase-like activity of phytase family protein [Conexibacter stalactiti]|uniref:Esterase-like activity of phytase family protein n=1 Tax=Conexibacter stalactiti TaxID=1940611 RepID=A0ABU4HML4_9ACTN|nr:esterase-like activity of phytase family protein [Conexibacter stalactiti]MDW5594542.1 esterase-like activity of phytase family protein [Conexibacter stalactiti]MEC5035184.1 esterase-like activity of phytase family protein [Conexibacter stalactiti]
MSRRTLAAATAAALALAAPAAAGAHGRHGGDTPAVRGVCSPDATLLGFSDQLDKTTFAGGDVGGLSALTLGGGAGWAANARTLVDNQGATNARTYDLRIGARGRHGRDGAPDVRVTGTTTLRRPDGTAYTGRDLDGEGLVTLRDGSLLVSSETEPSIRRFSRSGRQLGELPVPERFRIAPAGEASTNQALEGLGASPDGRTLFAAMEGPLSADGTTADGRARNRILRYTADRRGDWTLAGQLGYATDPGLAITEVQVVDDEQLLVLERGFVAGAGNTIRVYQAFLAGADDVSGEPTLARDGVRLVAKRLLADLGDCPPGDATNPGRQANPLLDNVEGMALGERLRDGARELYLLSDDNFSSGQVTRLYRLAVTLRDEPVLEARASYDALQWQPGPESGRAVTPANGVATPFPGQPVPGFSGALSDGRDGFWGMPDNGFGSKGNSADFLLRLYHVRPQWKGARGGSGRLLLDRFVSLRDPDRKIPFEIVNGATRERLLTGADFDLESVQRDRWGNLWFGEEFGPYLLQTSPDGRVLRAPVPLPGVKSPASPDLAPGETPNLPGSRGFEPMAASADGRTLYPILEGALTTEPDQTIRRVYEFDVRSGQYTGRTWSFHVSAPAGIVVGDAQLLPGNRLLMIERDDLEGVAARVKRLIEVDLDDAPAADGTLPTRTVLDLLRIRDPFGISLPAPVGGIGFGDPFAFPLQSVETLLPLSGDRLLIANDNNFPGSNGRVPGKPDDVEAIVVRVPGLNG